MKIKIMFVVALVTDKNIKQGNIYQIQFTDLHIAVSELFSNNYICAFFKKDLNKMFYVLDEINHLEICLELSAKKLQKKEK